MAYHRYVAAEMFGEARLVPRDIYVNGKRLDDPEEYDEQLWVERPEDLYALIAPGMRGKRVLVVRREDWQKSRGRSS